MISPRTPILPKLRVLLAAFNVLVAAFGAYVASASSDLSPDRDFAAAPLGSIRNRGDYVYHVAFGRSAIRQLIAALALTTTLMLVGESASSRRRG